MSIGPAHRNGKTQDTKEGEGGRKRQNGRRRERAAEVATSPRKSRVMPTRNCTTPRTPLPTLSPSSLHSFYTFPVSPHEIPLYLSFRLLLAFPVPPLPFCHHPLSLPSFLLSLATYLRCHYSLRRTTTTTTSTTFYRLRISPIPGE